MSAADRGDADSVKSKKPKQQKTAASPGQVFSFVWALNLQSRILFVVGCIFSVASGVVNPVQVYFFSQFLSELAGEVTLAQIRELAYIFMVIGVYAVVTTTISGGCLEIVAHRATTQFRLEWFRALLRQDAAYFDIYGNDTSSEFQANCNRFQRGLGKKLGAGIENMTMFISGLAFAFYATWKIALIIVGIVPFAVFFTVNNVRTNQLKESRASAAYSQAGSLAYVTVTSIRTVLSLNAVSSLINRYKEATLKAFEISVRPLWVQGFYFGGLFATFMCLFGVVTLLGTYLIQTEVRSTGCDPAASGANTLDCEEGGPEMYQAMLAFTFAAVGIGQFGNFLESFTPACVAAYPALCAIARTKGSPAEEIYEEETDSDVTDGGRAGEHTDEELGSKGNSQLKALLPKYEIDSSSDEGLKPENVTGLIEFRSVYFQYPTRPTKTIMSGLNLTIEAGKTTALVGASGGGKSTTVALIERFYDPTGGRVTIDGMDLKDVNVRHLRSKIGYVGQEPTLFTNTIGENIRCGKSSASQDEIEAAARAANAHDFIMSFPEGYATHVGNRGQQLSGGQKQRIAIARVLVSNPSILILDEATSALDSESELVVQEALDQVVEECKRTTIVIAHRLSTIRNADKIAVINGGMVVEEGAHDELLAADGAYAALVQKQERGSRSLSRTDLSQLEQEGKVHLQETASAFIEFKSVKFNYPSRPDTTVMNDFNLQINKGETVALVGPSGGGKSTVVSLIERFYDPIGGSVAFRGEDIRELNIGWLREQIGYVGQEPTLFNTTIAKNIAYGVSDRDVTHDEIVTASKQANIHDTIMGFPDGYETEVGATAQLSGGQKQRVAIARALIKKPSVLLLDEATSALDTESEALVQAALEEASKNRTTIVIAHRLSTIETADHIAFVANGRVLEYGRHDELMALQGRYHRLVDSQRRGNNTDTEALKRSTKADQEQGDHHNTKESEEDTPSEDSVDTSVAMARKLASPDRKFLCIGGVGAIFAGAVFPAWGYLYAELLTLLYAVVPNCPSSDEDECEIFFQGFADDMRDKSFQLGWNWAIVALVCLFGNMVTYWGFGMASERMNRRIRDSSFESLVRQEVGYYDTTNAASITSLLQHDAAQIHIFTGEPLRTGLIAATSLLIGLIVAFVFMWPLALVAIGCVPFVGAASSADFEKTHSLDERNSSKKSMNDDKETVGGVVVETLMNVKTVAALTLEPAREKALLESIANESKSYVFKGFLAGSIAGFSYMVQQWANGLQMWFGGWVLTKYPGAFTFNDFLISFLTILFCLVGLGSATSTLSDMKEVKLSARRVFKLLDRKTKIDPLSVSGKKLD